jgi:AcrR family transcriptional regulator
MGAAETAAGAGPRPQRGQSRRERGGSRSKDKLIEATISCMASYGPAGVSIERITRAAGVSRGLVRHHFGSKRVLLLEAFRRPTDEYRAAFSARDAAAAPGRAHAWFGFWQAALGDPDLREINERVYADERRRYAELFGAAALERDLAIDPHEAGIGLVALTDGAWSELLMDAVDFSIDDAVALCDGYIDMVLERGRLRRDGTQPG